MAIELQTFASGDTDYISKMNANVTTLTDAINGLQSQVQMMGGGDALSIGTFLGALFNFADALVGSESYKITKSATTLTLAPGGMYLQSEGSVVSSLNNIPLGFSGLSAGMYYIMVDITGQPSRIPSQLAGCIYSVYWSGTAFGAITYLVPIFFDTREADASRRSLSMGSPEKQFNTLDARLEQTEANALDAKEAAENAMGVAYELEGFVTAARYRKIGITLDGTTGVKGAIQIDFSGTIIGWSILGNMVGSIQVEVSTKASNKPPANPNIPNPVTDKISANAPVKLTGNRSAAAAEAGVSTWYTSLSAWDVVQFNVISVDTLTQAILYLRIIEEMPSPPVINPVEEWESPLEFREGGQ